MLEIKHGLTRLSAKHSLQAGPNSCVLMSVSEQRGTFSELFILTLVTVTVSHGLSLAFTLMTGLQPCGFCRQNM